MDLALPILIRVLHIGSAIALLGGTLYAVFTLGMALRVVDDGLRSSIVEASRRRFYRTSHPALVLLILTGFYSFFRDMTAYKEIGPIAHGLLGVKILLAIIILAIVFGQTFKVLKGSPATWAKVNLTLGFVIVILAAIVRQLRIEHLTGG